MSNKTQRRQAKRRRKQAAKKKETLALRIPSGNVEDVINEALSQDFVPPKPPQQVLDLLALREQMWEAANDGKEITAEDFNEALAGKE